MIVYDVKVSTEGKLWPEEFAIKIADLVDGVIGKELTSTWLGDVEHSIPAGSVFSVLPSNLRTCDIIVHSGIDSVMLLRLYTMPENVFNRLKIKVSE